VGLGQQLAGLPGGTPVALTPAVCDSIDWVSRSAMVNIGGGIVPARMSGTPPVLGATVWVLQVGDTYLCVGGSVLPALAKVLSRDEDGLWEVEADDTRRFRVSGPFGAEYPAGARVLMNWDAGGHIIMRVAGEVPRVPLAEAPPILPPSGTTQDRTFDFQPLDAGSWLGERWTTPDVIFGSVAAGWFYGSQITDSIPSTATIVSVDVLLIVGDASGAVEAQIGTHQERVRPVGEFPVGNLVSVGATPSGSSAFVRLPTTFGDALKTGAAAGVGTRGTGYRQFVRGSGTLRIKWRG